MHCVSSLLIVTIHKHCHYLRSGCGDLTLSSVSPLPDPCPLPDQIKKRSLNEKEKLIYAPMAGVGGIVYDKVRPREQLSEVLPLTYPLSCRMLSTLTWLGVTLTKIWGQPLTSW